MSTCRYMSVARGGSADFGYTGDDTGAELERRIDISNYDSYQARIFGFMSERLFNVWLARQSVRIKELPVVQF